ncbi:MAG TPA: hotdog fold thioesterase [Puia sp.]|jgi:1,4-dihydroxy-2-naphthoyl-CoA hydrolase|nr:hotdog fold thioesterase [Puia sp.]
MSIWFYPSVSIDQINPLGQNTMVGFLGIEFTEVGENFLKAQMPVDHRTQQPYGLLHGGASAVLAETMGSVASALVIDQAQFICVGLEINANHIKGVKEGFVFGTVTPIHIGSTTHVWDIRITDQQESLICVSRLTVAILKKR